MVRKFFALLVLVIMLLVVPLLVMLHALAASFLNPERITQTVLPESYEPVITEFVKNLARSPQETAIFNDRIRKFLPKEAYQEVGQALLTPVFQHINKISIKNPFPPIEGDLNGLKTVLKKNISERLKSLPPCAFEDMSTEEFRLCLPPGPPGFSMESEMMKSFDSSFAKQESEVRKILKQYPGEIQGTLFLVRFASQFLFWIVLVVTFFLTGLMALFIFSPFSKVLKWMASALIQLAFLTLLLVWPLMRLPEIFQKIQPITPSQEAFLDALLKYPVRYGWMWVGAFAASALAVFGLYHFLPHKKKS